MGGKQDEESTENGMKMKKNTLRVQLASEGSKRRIFLNSEL